MRLLVVLLLLLTTACTAVGEGGSAGPSAPPSDPAPGTPSSVPDEEVAVIRVASGPDAETALLAHTLAALLTRGGLTAEVVPFSDARDARQALELGRVDVRPSYTGEAWLETLGLPDPPSDALESYLAVAEHDRDEGIAWLRPRFADGVDTPPANATFAFVVAGPPSVDADLSTVSQLAARLSERPDATLCVDQEFVARSDGLRAVLAAYSVRSDQPVLAAAPQEAVRGVVAGDCLAGLTTATDGVAWRAGLRPLTDDLGVFPAFVPLPQVRDDAAEAHRSLRSSIGPFPAQLTTELLAAGNARIQGDDALEDVADDLAVELLRRAGRPVTPPVPRT
jgi:osmoprotectant transport system substrate-binding protein